MGFLFQKKTKFDDFWDHKKFKNFLGVLNSCDSRIYLQNYLAYDQNFLKYFLKT